MMTHDASNTDHAVSAQAELARWQQLEPVRGWIKRGTVPTAFIVEQLLMLLSRGDDLRYRMLAEPSGRVRARFALSELAHLRALLDGASERSGSVRRGVSRN